MNFTAMSDIAVLAEVGQRVRQERLNQNMEQAILARQAGISRRTLQRLEAGGVSTLATMVRVLRALGKLNAIDAFLPSPGISPIQLARLRGAKRQRASGQRGPEHRRS